jgi:F0F1-type ATP synthase assembly protein I
MPATKSPQEKRNQAIKDVGRYSGLAFQLFGAALAGVLIGRWIDQRWNHGQPLFAGVLAMFFIFASLYALYRQLR